MTHKSLPGFVKRSMVDTTNAQAAAEGVGFGGSMYKDFQPFDLPEMNRMMGLLFVNVLSPRPRINILTKTKNGSIK